MNWEEALKQLKQGNKVRRQAFYEGLYMRTVAEQVDDFEELQLQFFESDQRQVTLCLCIDDFEANDWEVVN